MRITANGWCHPILVKAQSVGEGLHVLHGHTRQTLSSTQKVFKLPFCRIAAIRGRQQREHSHSHWMYTVVQARVCVTPPVLTEVSVKALKLNSPSGVCVFDPFIWFRSNSATAHLSVPSHRFCQIFSMAWLHVAPSVLPWIYVTSSSY